MSVICICSEWTLLWNPLLTENFRAGKDIGDWMPSLFRRHCWHFISMSVDQPSKHTVNREVKLQDKQWAVHWENLTSLKSLDVLALRVNSLDLGAFAHSNWTYGMLKSSLGASMSPDTWPWKHSQHWAISVSGSHDRIWSQRGRNTIPTYVFLKCIIRWHLCSRLLLVLYWRAVNWLFSIMSEWLQ